MTVAELTAEGSLCNKGGKAVETKVLAMMC
jgi:hypothetical protein